MASPTGHYGPLPLVPVAAVGSIVSMNYLFTYDITHLFLYTYLLQRVALEGALTKLLSEPTQRKKEITVNGLRRCFKRARHK